MKIAVRLPEAIPALLGLAVVVLLGQLGRSGSEHERARSE